MLTEPTAAVVVHSVAPPGAPAGAQQGRRSGRSSRWRARAPSAPCHRARGARPARARVALGSRRLRSNAELARQRLRASRGGSARGLALRVNTTCRRKREQRGAASSAASLSSSTTTTATSARPVQRHSGSDSASASTPAGVVRAVEERLPAARSTTSKRPGTSVDAARRAHGLVVERARANASRGRARQREVAPLEGAAREQPRRRLGPAGATTSARRALGAVSRASASASGCRSAPTTSVAPGAHDGQLLAPRCRRSSGPASACARARRSSAPATFDGMHVGGVVAARRGPASTTATSTPACARARRTRRRSAPRTA